MGIETTTVDPKEQERILKDKTQNAYIKEHPGRFVARLILEPGYTIRWARNMSKENEYKECAIRVAIALDSLKVLAYGFVAYNLLK